MTTMTAQAAIELLRADPSAYATPEALRALVAQLSVQADGATTVLYGGSINGVDSGDAIQALLSQGADIRVLDKTEAYAFLKSDEFIFAVAGIHNTTREQLDLDLRNSVRTPATNWLFDAKHGPWADISKAFAAATTGTVRFIGPEANFGRIFGQTELPELMRVGAVTSIEGIPLSELKLIVDQGGEAAFNAIRAASTTNIAYSGLRLVTIGSSPVASGVDDFLNKVTNLEAYLLESPGAHKRFDEYMNDFRSRSQVLFDEFKATAKVLMMGDQELPVGSRVLGRLPLLGVFVTLGLAANSASAAEEAGDSEKAKEIMELWAAEAAGSRVGESVGAIVGGIAAAALAGAGVAMSAPLIGALVLAGTILGGIFGEEAASDLYQLTKNRDGNENIDLWDKILNAIYGATYTISDPFPTGLDGERLTLNARFSREEMVVNAKTDVAWRYALRELNPFVIPNISYDRHNQDGSLDLYDPATGKGQMTELYLEDRAAMLTWMIRYELGMQDDNDSVFTGRKPYNEDWDTSAVEGNWDFVDLSKRLPGGAPLTLAIDGRGLSLADHQVVFGTKETDSILGGDAADHLYGMTGDDEIKGGKGNDHIEGGIGKDHLEGGEGTDVIYGMDGEDNIRGDKGDDYLFGGEGFDSYIIKSGDGIDIIRDADRQGIVLIDGYDLDDATQVKDNVWTSDDKRFRYMLVTEADGSTTLHVTMLTASADQKMTYLKILEFQSGQFGINLGGLPALPQPPQGDILGDVLVTSDPVAYDSYGNVIGTASVDLRADMLLGGATTDIIYGGYGNDVLYGKDGDDRLSGDDGSDLLAGGLGEDHVSGGWGNDILYGDSTHSTVDLRAGTQVMQPSGTPPYNGTFVDAGIGWIRYLVDYQNLPPVSNANPDAVSSVLYQLDPERFGSKNYTFYQELAHYGQRQGADDYLDGGAGNDILYGEAGNDTIEGGWGADKLHGGSGNDYLEGGTEDDLLMGDGLVYAAFLFTTYDLMGLYRSTAEIERYEDEFGDDMLYGGDGDDFVFGMAGADIVSGGAGNDYLVGDFFEVVNIPMLRLGEDGQTWIQDTETYFQQAVVYHGDDLLEGGDGDDYLVGLAGDDKLYGQAGNDVLVADGNPDEVQGRYGNDYLDGGSDNDFLQGSGGDDELLGGTGDDELWGDEYAGTDGQPVTSWGGAPVNGGSSAQVMDIAKHGRDSLYGGDGKDTLTGGGANDTLDGGSGDDLIFGDGIGVTGSNEGDDVLYGRLGNDQLQGNGGNDMIYGGEGLDKLYGQDGADSLLGEAGDDYLEGGKGDDALDGGDGVDTLWGNDDNDTLLGGAGDDLITGGAGNDTITGGIGRDYQDGGEGNDVYVLKAGDGQIVDNTYEMIIDSAGTDTLRFDGVDPSAIVIRKSATAGDIALKYGSNDGVYIKGGLSGAIDTVEFAGGASMSFGQFMVDRLVDGLDSTASTSGSGLYGSRAGDLLTTLNNNVVVGGLGNDRIYLHGSSNTVVLRNGDGKDEVGFRGSAPHENRVRFDLGVAPEDIQVFLTEGYYSYNLNIHINGDPNYGLFVNGVVPDNILEYGKYLSYFDFVADDGSFYTLTFEELLAQRLEFPFTLGNDTAVGTNFDETFDGLWGNDYIRAGAGSDVLKGDVGNDSLDGGAGDDILIGGAGSDWLVGGAGADTYVFAKSDGEDSLYGDQQAGDVAMLAYLDEELRFQHRDGKLFISAIGSLDSITVWSYFTGDGTGNSVALEFETADGVRYGYAGVRAKALDGTAGNDFIIGLNGNDSISGLAGDDTLAGGSGNDTLDGGAGDDILALEAGDDTFVFGVGSGHDTIQAVSYVPTHYGVGSDTILMNALLPSEVMATRVSAEQMALGIIGTDDWIAFSSTNPGFADLKIRFADGTVWTSAMVQAKAPLSEGADTLSLLNTNDSLHMLGGNDTVHAMGGNDAIYGDAGNDVLNGGDGNDYLDGGIGDDTLRGEAGDDSLSGEDGIDVLYGGAGSDSLSGGTGRDTLYGEDGWDDLSGDKDGQIDTLVGGNDGDYYYIGESIDQIVETLDGGNDSVNLYYSGTYKMASYVENVRLYWGDTGSQITGNTQDNYIDAEYSTQADTLSGGAGDDTYYHVTSVDQVIESSTGGIDTVYAARDTYYLDQYIENAILINPQGSGVFYSTWTLTGNASNNYLANQSTFKAEIYGGGGDDTLSGSWGDTLYGDAGNDSLYGGGTLYGGAGNDSLYGSGTLHGGTGTNLLVGSDAGDALFSQGVDDVLYGGGGYDSFNLGAGFATCVLLAGDEYASISTGTGEFALEFRDAHLADISVKVNQSYQLEITYEAGGVVVMSTDSLGKLRNIVTQEGAMTAAAWFDWLKASPGYYTGNIKLVGTGAESTASARYTMERSGGDLLLGSLDAAGQSLGSFSLGAVTPMDNTDAYRIEADGRLRLVGVGDGPTSFQLSGFTFHAGSTLDDDLTTVGKNWALDWYVGGEGRDTYTWGLKSGNDVVDATTPDGVRDVVLIEAGLDLSTLRMEQSADDLIIRQQNGYTLSLRQYFRNESSAPIVRFADGSELSLAGLYYGLYRATEGDDVITGNSSAEKLFGWTGNDVLQGLGGNDTLDGGAGLDQLMGGNGDDVYYYADQDVITENQNEGYDRVYSWLSLVLPQHVEAVVLMGSDALDATGNEAANALDGNSAANRLDGGAGADNLRGGAGDDLYIVDNSSDYVYEGQGAGQDRVEASASFVLAGHVEDLTLTGTLAINGTGNDLANVIRGNIAANALAGGLGDDTYYIANGDTVTENNGAGQDTVISEVSFVLGSNVENLRLVEGSGAVSATGNVLINNLYGNAMGNMLSGGTGADNMEGGAGDDIYVVDNIGDVVVEKLGEGTDTIQSSVAYLLSANVENLTLTGSASVGATGNGLDNILTGNSGANVMTGGAGNDTYVVTAKDTIKENVGEGIDTVRSAVAWTLGANLENIVLTGTSKIAATGNELNNRLDGSQNASANALKGGKGNDTYIVGTGDVVTENLGEGSDTVESAIAWTLGANLENLTLTGSTAVNGTGNTLANQLRGNTAANTLTGLAGNDTYLFGRGGGADTIVDSDSTAGNQDVLRLDAGIALDQLWFRHVSNHLEVSVIGSNDKVTISNWYGGSTNHVETIQLADGHFLVDAKVEQLVQAMATLTPPPLGQTSLSDTQRQQLEPALAASWQIA